ncbi:hypothetical protein BN8_04910 [Fibrisoma limi BUZ 3]|uniref:Curlin associated repeat-containing protein n=1 Tax=Fibrisoma limi BUZ 3 TaxID=1185876 RepID=I2GP09_9BACT|nr:curlin repeat-containing protein [Fibrisoma limi]CCH55637.1 hypothetical protein BN8_04910 [Fibrisoma limi BUZ 3]
MKKPLLAGLAMLSVSAAFGQNSVSINQSGGSSGNRAVVSQSGSGNSIVINQSSDNTDDSSKTTESKSRSSEGNQVSLRVGANTQTTINQHNSGPNSVELQQEGNSSATINQSSGTNENTIELRQTEPAKTQPTRKTRPFRRRNRP